MKPAMFVREGEAAGLEYAHAASSVALLLEPGDHLSREEFERRYHALPHVKKAELLRGIVYMPSPVRFRLHAAPHALLITWLTTYTLNVPGLETGDNCTMRLGPEDEPQPDGLIRMSEEWGGQSTVDAEGYLCGAPELAAEVATSSASYDLHVKREVYCEYGVREYLVWRVADRAVDWFVRRDDGFAHLEPGPDGILRSETFPGLWLDPAALLRGDGTRLLAVLHEGLRSPEHAAFVARHSNARNT